MKRKIRSKIPIQPKEPTPAAIAKGGRLYNIAVQVMADCIAHWHKIEYEDSGHDDPVAAMDETLESFNEDLVKALEKKGLVM